MKGIGLGCAAAATALLFNLRHQVQMLSLEARDAAEAARRSSAELAATLAELDALQARVADLFRTERSVLVALTEVTGEHRQLVEQTGHLREPSELLAAIDQRTREMLYAVRMVPQDVESQTLLRHLVRGRAPLPVAGGWGMDARSLLSTILLLRRTRPSVAVELGSGASTIWLGYVQEQHGGTLVSLEHLDGFAEDTRRHVDEHGLDDIVDVRLAPLQTVHLDGQQWTWYDPASLQGVGPVDMVIVDGPPKAVGPLSRYPAMSMLLPVLADEAWVVLDDARRPDERKVLRRWLDEYPDLRRLQTTLDDMAMLHYRRMTRQVEETGAS